MKNNKGSAFITAIISMFSMALLSGVLYKMTTQDTHLIHVMKKGAQAQSLAEAGLAHALATLKADWNSRNSDANFPTTSLDAGTFNATIVQSNGRVLVQSVGTVQGTTRTVSAEVSGPSGSALDYAIAGHSVAFLLEGGSHLEIDHGSVYSDTTVGINAKAGSSQVELQSPGKIDAGTTITISGAGSVTTGTKTPNASLMTWPTIDFNYYKNIAIAKGTYANADITYKKSNTMPSAVGGVLFVNGNITISANQSTKSAIIATGDITVTGGTLSINQTATYPALMTQNGTITFSGVGNSSPSELSASGLVYSGNNFTVTGNHHHIDVTGAILAKGAFTSNDNGAAQNHMEINYSKPNISGLSNGAGASGSMTIKSYTA